MEYTKDDVIYCLERLKNYIYSMTDEVFSQFMSFTPVYTQYMKPDWNLDYNPKDIDRKIIRLKLMRN